MHICTYISGARNIGDADQRSGENHGATIDDVATAAYAQDGIAQSRTGRLGTRTKLSFSEQSYIVKTAELVRRKAGTAWRTSQRQILEHHIEGRGGEGPSSQVLHFADVAAIRRQHHQIQAIFQRMAAATPEDCNIHETSWTADKHDGCGKSRQVCSRWPPTDRIVVPQAEATGM